MDDNYENIEEKYYGSRGLINLKERLRFLYDKDREPDLATESLIHDPVRMYLGKMGTVPLLTRGGEIEIAKRIEKGQRTVINALSHSPVVIARILKYRKRLKKNELNIKNLVRFHEDELTDEILKKRRTKV